MAAVAAGSDPVDAIAQLPVASLFPPTFGALQNVSGLHDLERELDSLDSHLRTIALENPKKLLDKAKAVMESCVDFKSNGAPSEVDEAEKHQGGEAMGNERPSFSLKPDSCVSPFRSQPAEDAGQHRMKEPRPRRPGMGLGLKRPRFSLKPDDSCQPVVGLVDFDFDNPRYEDPDEFFDAFERTQRANREVMRQMGIDPEDQGHHRRKEPRPRRPGLLGRSYRHKFSLSAEFLPEPVMEESVVVSDSTLQENVEDVSPDKSQEMDFSASAKAEEKHNELLDELLSQDLEDLDGDGTTNLILEKLHIKPINIDKLEIPPLKQYIQNDDLNASVGKLRKPRRALLDIQNTGLREHGHSPTSNRGGLESSRSYLSSKSATKSPLAQISSLLYKKRLLSEISSSNPFSPVYGHDMAARSSVDGEHAERQFEDVSERHNSVVSSPYPGELMSKSNEQQIDVVIGSKSKDLQNEIANHDLQMMDECLDRSNTVLASQAQKDGAKSSNPSVESEDSSAAEVNKDEDNLSILVSSIVQDAGYGFSNCPGSVEVLASAQAEKEAAPTTQPDAEVDQNTGSEEDEEILVSTEIEELASNGQCPCDAPEQQTEEPIAPAPSGKRMKKLGPSNKSRRGNGASTIESSKESENPVVTEHRKNKEADEENQNAEDTLRELHNGERVSRPHPKKSRLEDRRMSLAGAGTSWDGGVRKSTRIKSRPLAFWKGERFLYGRIHESLATVIGVKYESPGDAARKPSLKVKSFVPEKYKELVDLVSS